MASLQSSPILHQTLFLNSSSKRRCNILLVKAAQSSESIGSTTQERTGRRQALAAGATLYGISLLNAMPIFAAESKKGFQAVSDKKDGYSFLYPFGWQEVVIQGQDKHDADGKAYYTFEFTAQAPNFTRHALGAISIANGKFYTLTTGANERRWEKMKDKLHTVVDSFTIFKSDPSAPPA